MSDRFSVVWHDHGCEPECQPDPNYPDGKDVVAVLNPIAKTCKVALDCPAKRCGHYLLQCFECGTRVAVTTAGRPDDPRSLTLECGPLLRGGLN